MSLTLFPRQCVDHTSEHGHCELVTAGQLIQVVVDHCIRRARILIVLHRRLNERGKQITVDLDTRHTLGQGQVRASGGG